MGDAPVIYAEKIREQRLKYEENKLEKFREILKEKRKK